MKRYEAYKPVTSRWAKQLPFYWEFQKIAEVFIERKENNDPIKTTNILSLTNTRGIIPYSDKGNLGNKAKNDIRGYRLAYPGDIVLNSMNVVIGSVGLSQYYGAVSPVYYMLYVRDNAKYNVRYYNYVFRDKIFQGGLNGLGNGILEIRMRIPMSKLKYVCVPVPPRDEQDQIVRYLDWQVSKINRLIAAKRKQIELLNQTIAHNLERIICEGMHGEELVETGNPWISTAPKSWNKLRHKNILTEKKIVVGDTYSQYTLLSLTTKGIIVRDISSGKGKFPSDFSTYQVVQPSDMVFCLFDVDETPRTVGLSAYTGMITGAYTVYETHDVVPEFLLHYFTAIDNRKGFKPLYSGLRKVIGKDVFSRQSIYLPSVEEQKEIVAAIDASQKKCKKAMDLFEQEIIALTDLRTRLISDVVTGKIDVRSIKVPDYELVDDVVQDSEDGEPEVE